MQADPLYRCWEHVVKTHGTGLTVYLSPQGRVFTQTEARRLLECGRLILVCGHYEGVDERFIEACVDVEISIGDYVLTGGELAACVVADAVCRMVPGVLRDESGFTGESHWDGLLEYPHYSRPEIWRGRAVPEVLLSGHHANIEAWRREQSLERTRRKRPDLLD
jgi:tRNA (guanine37-N1)-methyltransferase